jgi:lipoprotein-anchoring transpeptidase ErfK/SrfK
MTFVALERSGLAGPPSIGVRYGAVIPGGNPDNPMGMAVHELDRANYAIHGTNDPPPIGGYVSHGCIRMYNSNVIDLYARAGIGTQVMALR